MFADWASALPLQGTSELPIMKNVDGLVDPSLNGDWVSWIIYLSSLTRVANPFSSPCGTIKSKTQELKYHKYPGILSLTKVVKTCNLALSTCSI